MSNPAFVYVRFIASTPERVFDALTNAELTNDYWVRHRNASPDWRPGSRWEHQDYDDPSRVDLVDDVDEVVEHDPPRRLVVTWRAPSGEGEESRVTYVVEPHEGVVKLTVTHDGLVPGSEMDRGIRGGWPVVLSSIKTLLETGQALPFTMARWSKSKH
ncbi:SRPBCC family protein [Burkholderia ubonensis]|uniref:Activator of Hsp90 ATPase homologue 1/2-like C-terminal domain-containing protein n=1 Tax=Burkholderia ubonensis subsp. mesacidophila TaxID=265293 RepID=A0A2A4F897_9BURK|nr:SRPBCC family protein [Burkholderia ubonensis]PCE29375.1 hypothetical protein BZL54_26860 [Burkholderia ubonensis subsp. mesacidophila]